MKKTSTLSTVISCNPYNSTYYTGSSTSIEKAKKPKFSKEQYAISSLRTKSFLTAKVQLSKNIDEEDYFDVIENKIYEELGLDMATEYKIDFYEIEEEQDESNRTFNVFVVDPHDFKEEFASVIDEIRYIDQIYPVPLLIRSLYKKEIIRDNGVECFIYFSEDDAFLTLYKDAEFLYTKELKFTLGQIHELFCEIYGERVNYDDFLTLFIEEGLRTTNEENKGFLIKLFNELFTQISDVLNFAKRAYELDDIHKIYIGSSAGVVFGMDEFAQTTLGVKTRNFDFEYGFNVNEFYVDQIQQLLHLTAQLVSEDRYDLNFTIFNRPPPFIYRESGRLITLAAGTLLVVSLYPLWNLTYAAFTEFDKENLKKEYRQISQEKSRRKSLIDKQTKIKLELDKKTKTERALLSIQDNVLTQIHMKKVKYPMKAKIIASLTKDLNKYRVQLSSISYSEDEKDKSHYFNLNMVSRSEKQMTDMIEKLTSDNIQNYKVTIEDITFNAEGQNYQSNLKVALR